MNLETLANTPSWEWPEGTGAMLLGILRDDRAGASQRLLAAELAGDLTVMDDELAEALLAIVQRGEETVEMRSMAAIALGPALEEADTMGFADPDDAAISEALFEKVQQTLRELFLDTAMPRDVRRMILEASVRAPREWHQQAVRDAYASDDDTWRLTAVFCMCYMGGFEEQIRESLDSEDPEIHYQAVRAAGNWEVDAAWPHIAALVASDRTDKPLRLAAIEAAASIRPQEAQDLLADLADSDDEDLHDAALEALMMAGGFPMFGEEELDDEGLGDEFEDEEDEKGSS